MSEMASPVGVELSCCAATIVRAIGSIPLSGKAGSTLPPPRLRGSARRGGVAVAEDASEGHCL